MDAICRIFLEQSKYELALEAAISELDDRNTSKKRGHAGAAASPSPRSLSEKDVVRLKNDEAFSDLQDCAQFNLLDLCRNPHYAITHQPLKCAKFGKERILRAVSYGKSFPSDPWKQLTEFSSKYFRKLSKYDLLKLFHEVGNIDTATLYAAVHKEYWSSKELVDIVDVLGLPFPIGAELLKRGQAMQAIHYALNSNDEEIAVEASSHLLKTPVDAQKNIVNVITAWRTYELRNIDSPLSLLKLIRSLNYDPDDEMAQLLISFGPSVTAALKIDGNKLNVNKLDQIIQFHEELRMRIGNILGDRCGADNSMQLSDLVRVDHNDANVNERASFDVYEEVIASPVPGSTPENKVSAAQKGKKTKKKNRRSRKKK